MLGCACIFPISPQKNQLPFTSFLPLISHSLWHDVASEGDLWPPSHISCFSSSIPESWAELRAPQPVAPQDWALQGCAILQQITKEEASGYSPLLLWWLWLPGWQKYPVGFHFHRQKVPVKGSGSCTPAWLGLLGICAQDSPKQPLGWGWFGVRGGLRDGGEGAGVSPDSAAASAQPWPCHLLQMERWRRTSCEQPAVDGAYPGLE